MAASAAAMWLGVGKSEGAAASSEASATANDAAGVSSLTRMTRVYIGGLGGAVTVADVEKTFAPLGRVSRVEFVRTKGRSFAFMDFEPKSDKSFAKLFATYNGCIWKGGRLRLEKAKEHYLNRWRREWEEDAESSKKPIVVDMSKGLSSSDKSVAEEKMQLRFFFPKLRRVKTLPFKGTGKHKYSFQRIATTHLPVHFCDCEEHCQTPENPGRDQRKYTKDQAAVVNEKELIIMYSVMKKLFEMEANTSVADGKVFSATERDILDDSKNETQFGDSEAAQQSDSDADNLVTNIGLGNGEDVLNLMQLKGWDAASPDQQQDTRKRQIIGPGTVSEAFCSKRAHLPSDKSTESKFSSTVAGKIGHRETEHEEENNYLPSIQSQGSNIPTEGPDIVGSKTTQDLDFGQSAKITSWIQKSSWKELLGDSGSSTFTISHVLPPGVDSLSARLSKCNGAESIRSSAERMGRRFSVSSCYLEPTKVTENIPVKKIAAPEHEDRSGKGDGKYVGGVDAAPRSSGCQEPKADGPKIGVGQVCTFMRSAESLKEWRKTKAALSGHLKKKQQQQQHETATSEGGKNLLSARR